VANNPNLFVDITETRLLRSKDTPKQEATTIEEALKERLQSLSRDDVVDVLGEIFPKIKELFDKGSDEFGIRQWFIDQRACADHELFSRYFRFEVDAVDLSAKDISDLMEASNDRDALRTIFENAVNEPDRIHRTLERLGDMRGGSG
jgi:hypothetical protein